MSDSKYTGLFLLLALCLPVAIACVDIMAVSVALNPIMTQFSASISETQWLISAYTIGTASFLILVGKLADLYGRRKLLLWGISLFGLASVMAASAPAMLILILARFLQGVASSMMMTTVVSIIVHRFEHEERTHVLSKWALSLGAGMSLGPLVGGIILHFASWPFIFVVNIPICIASYYLAVKYIPESKDPSGKIKIRWGEAVLLSLVLILLVLIFSEGEILGWQSHLMSGLILSFLVAVCFYGLVLRYRGSVFVDLSLFKLKNYFEGAACGFLSYFCMYAWLFIFGLYLQKDCGMSPLQTGMMFISYSATSAVCSHFIGKIIKKWGRKIPVQFGFGTALIAFLWMSHITPHTPIWQLIIMSAMLGVMLTFVNVPSMNLAMSSIPPEKTGIASGTVFTIRWLGGSIGVAIITLIFQVGSGFSALTPMSYACFGMAFFVAIGFLFGSLIRPK